MELDWEAIGLLDTEGLEAKITEVKSAISELQNELGVVIDQGSALYVQVEVMADQLWPEQRDRLLFDLQVAEQLWKRLDATREQAAYMKLMHGVDGNGHVNRAARRQAQREMRRNADKPDRP